MLPASSQHSRTFPSFQIDSASRVQWKLLLEQNSIGYVFPDETQPSAEPNAPQHTTPPDEDWQIVIPISMATKSSPSTESAMSKSSEFEGNKERPDDEPATTANADAIAAMRARSQSPPPSTSSAIAQMSVSQIGAGIFPAARARLASLRDLGAKKIGALKLKLIENKIKSNERGNMARIGQRREPAMD